ncbi:I78 family peptidase inhibitor [Pseudomonas sp. 5P_3.1_Bac2]|uniref:I78 family peptidase inhibitor n=1 Tax=Pseudomonas sp. 5P_3.1_Bac2 TaxID=2971617 RepID=UPI0021C58849|nr:I78 family peptidase inhibitor [Pseudomonas sp. 5P_3.1_Bac2]MCU1716413.1 I78 family peptidase inhibitor [Pseudomonas sp. 5P_3.1_Bac2]
MHPHRLLSLALITLLAGCSSAQRADDIEQITGNCNAESLRAQLGQQISVERVEQLQLQANAKLVRVLAPGDMASQEFNPQRLTIDIDESEAILHLHCG